MLQASRRRFHPLIKTLQSHCTLFCSELIVNHTSTSYIIHVTYARLFSLFVLPAHDNAAGGTHRPTHFTVPQWHTPPRAMPSAAELDYVSNEIMPTLQRGLHALCKEKPADPRTWLAQWLLANKPTLNLQAEGAAAAQQALIDMYKSEDGQAELKALFATLDKDGDGSVSAKEWGKGVAQHWKTMSRFFGGVSQKKVGKLFKSLDTDSSGDLSWDEFCGAIEGVDAEAALARAMATADGFEKLKTLFASLDKDGDGTVSAEEWSAALTDPKNKKLAKKFFGKKSVKNKKALIKAFKKLDADGSGDLTWDEFVAGSKRIVVVPETALAAETKAKDDAADAAAKVQASIRGRQARAKK